MNKLHLKDFWIEEIKEIARGNLVDLEVVFTLDDTAVPIKWQNKLIPMENIEQFYYDEGLDHRELLGPSHLDSSYDSVWKVDFWDEVRDGCLEKFVRDYLIENLK